MKILKHLLMAPETGDPPAGGGDPPPAGGGDPPPATATIPDSGGILDGLNFREDWYNDVDDAAMDPYRETASRYKSMPDLFKSLHDTKAALSQRSEGMVKLPGADASDEDIAAFREATGVPADADSYDIKPPENLPEGVEFQDGSLQSFREFALENGFSNAQAQAMINFQTAAEGVEIAEYNAEVKAKYEQGHADLRTEWGAKAQENETLARRVAKTYNFPDEMLGEPAVLRMLAEVGNSISEDKFVPASELGDLTAGNEAKDIIANESNPLNKPYWDPNHPDHERAVSIYQQKMEEQTRREGYDS